LAPDSFFEFLRVVLAKQAGQELRCPALRECTYDALDRWPWHCQLSAVGTISRIVGDPAVAWGQLEVDHFADSAPAYPFGICDIPDRFALVENPRSDTRPLFDI
jgi:hypothetical protein